MRALVVRRTPIWGKTLPTDTFDRAGPHGDGVHNGGGDLDKGPVVVPTCDAARKYCVYESRAALAIPVMAPSAPDDRFDFEATVRAYERQLRAYVFREFSG